MKILVQKFVKNPLGNNNYVVIDEETSEAVLVDCSEACDDIIGYVKENGAVLKYILLTHAHFDHVMGVNYFKEKYGIDAFVFKDEEYQIKHCAELAATVGFPDVEIPVVAGTFDVNRVFSLGNNEIKVIHTPGHTKGSVCFFLDNILFSGDTLFQGTYGRTDLPGGDSSDMMNSLSRLFSLLKDDTIVYPGHGKSTTIQEEKLTYAGFL